MFRAPPSEQNRVWIDGIGSSRAGGWGGTVLSCPRHLPPAPAFSGRLRRIDAFATCLWALLLGLHLAEQYLQAASPRWLDTLKFSTTSLCCLVGFTAAVATKKATGPRRFQPRRSEKQQ